MIAAFSIEEFLVPCTILDGGIVGISIMINNLSKIPLGVLTLVLNLPFLFAGMRKLGIKFIAKSAVAMVVFSSFLEIFVPLTDITRDYLPAVCFGGVFLGMGVGLVIRSGGCLDGTETVAIFLNRLEIYQLKQLIKEVDAQAFITISDVSEIIGNHIKKRAEEEKL